MGATPLDTLARFKNDEWLRNRDPKSVAKHAIREITRLRQELHTLRRRAEALEIIANGCSKHPSYRAKRAVNTQCAGCLRLIEARVAVDGVEP